MEFKHNLPNISEVDSEVVFGQLEKVLKGWKFSVVEETKVNATNPKLDGYIVIDTVKAISPNCNELSPPHIPERRDLPVELDSPYCMYAAELMMINLHVVMHRIQFPLIQRGGIDIMLGQYLSIDSFIYPEREHARDVIVWSFSNDGCYTPELHGDANLLSHNSLIREGYKKHLAEKEKTIN